MQENKKNYWWCFYTPPHAHSCRARAVANVARRAMYRAQVVEVGEKPCNLVVIVYVLFLFHYNMLVEMSESAKENSVTVVEERVNRNS